MVRVLQKAVNLEILSLHIVHAQRDGFIQHLVKLVLCTIMDYIHQYLYQ